MSPQSYTLLCVSSSVSHKVALDDMCSVDTHCVVEFNSVPHTLSLEYSPEHQIRMNPPLTIVHYKCTATSF